MKINKHLLFAFCFFNLAFVQAQDKVVIDSLERQLKYAITDTAKIGTLNALSLAWAEYNTSTAKMYAQQALRLSIANHNKKLLARSYEHLAIAFDNGAAYDTAVMLYKKALTLSRQVKDEEEESSVLNNLGWCYSLQDKNKDALESYIKSAAISERLHDTINYANCLNNIGVVYRNTGDLKSAIYVYKKALLLKEALRDKRGVYICSCNLIVAFHEFKNLDMAFAYADKALLIAKEMNKPTYIASVYGMKAPLYGDLKNYPKAIELFKDAIELLETYSDNLYERTRYISMLAEEYQLNGELKNSLEQHQKAYKLAQRIGDSEAILRSLNGIAGIYAKQKNYERAFEYQIQYNTLKDSFSTQNINKDLNEIKARFETELKDKEIEQVKAKNDLAQLKIEEQARNSQFLSAIVILFLGLAIALFFFFLQKNRASRKIEEQNKKIAVALTEKEALLREIHHRVKNNLQVISGLLELQEVHSENAETKKMVDEAQNRIKSMSITHEMLYQTSDLAAINVEEYVNRLAQSVEMSFASSFRVEKKFNLKGVFFNIDSIIPLGLILNELMTNSYKYAFSSERENKLYISITQNGDIYQLTFADNGGGLLETTTNVGLQRSFGLRLINMLVRQLKGKVDYQFDMGAKFLISFYQK